MYIRDEILIDRHARIIVQINFVESFIFFS